MSNTRTGATLILLAATLLGLARHAPATILRVPLDFPGIQAAMNASAMDDTVLVERGTWTGLYTSPVHRLTLCSNYLFSGDSTDINETILDGEYVGTILTVNTTGDALLTVTGFTMSHGMSFDIGGSLCYTGGAIRMEGDVNACFSDIVFSDNRSEQGAAILFHGTVCSGISATGDLTLRGIHCVGNVSDHPETIESSHLIIRPRRSKLIINGFNYDGCGTSTPILDVLASRMDTVAVSNMNAHNCNNSLIWLGLSVERRTTMVLENIVLSGCRLYSQFTHFEVDSSFVRVTNIDISGDLGLSGIDVYLLIRPALSTLIAEDIRIHDIRCSDNWNVTEIGSWTTAGTLSNFQVYNNVMGDSMAVLPGHVISPMVRLYRVDLINAHIHDNRIIIPADPDIGQTDGNYLVDGGFVTLLRGNHCVENVLLENNRIDDLDDYQHPGSVAPRENQGREFYAATQDTLRLKNIIIRNSRRPNWCPEWVGDYLSKGDPGSVLVASAPFGYAENILIENCDDGGLICFGREATNIVIRNVGRMGARFGNYEEDGLPAIHVRNLHIENVDLADDYLQPEYADQFGQYALGLFGQGNFENVTITGCDSLRYPIKLWWDAQAQFRNSLFWDNQSGPLAYTGSGGTVSWDHCLAPVTLPGPGNLVAIPRFDSQLGPPFLALDSPCIDAGNPDPVYNDPEDPASPDFPLWPSLGNLRNDIGFTGGPHAALMDTNWVAVPAWEPRPRPADFRLGAPWPNPFNPVTRIPFTLMHPMPVRLSVHNLLGQEVAVLAEGPRAAGAHQVRFPAGRLASGLYLVTLEAGGRAETRTVTLLR